jgi:hypothetical protein
LAFTATTSTRIEMMTSSSTVRGRAPKPGIQSARSPLPTPALRRPGSVHRRLRRELGAGKSRRRVLHRERSPSTAVHSSVIAPANCALYSAA